MSDHELTCPAVN